MNGNCLRNRLKSLSFSIAQLHLIQVTNLLNECCIQLQYCTSECTIALKLIANRMAEAYEYISKKQEARFECEKIK